MSATKVSITRAASAIIVALVLAAATARGQGEAPAFDENQEKLVSKEPPFAVTRPNKEWVFIDLERAKAKELREHGFSAAEEAFKTLKARLWHGGHPADLYIHSWPDNREDASSEKVGLEVLEQTNRALKDAKVTGKGPTTLGKHKAFAFEIEGTFQGKPLAVSKVVVWREADKQTFVISLECPKDRAKVARKDLAKLLKGIQL
jgi:hypothetical protein